MWKAAEAGDVSEMRRWLLVFFSLLDVRPPPNAVLYHTDERKLGLIPFSIRWIVFVFFARIE